MIAGNDLIDARAVDTFGTADYSFGHPAKHLCGPIGAACTFDPANLGDANGENGW